MDLQLDSSERETFDLLVVRNCPKSILKLIRWHSNDPVNVEEIARNELLVISFVT